jgi:hypothetical protein
VLLDEEWLRPPDMEYRKHESYVMTTVSWDNFWFISAAFLRSGT